MKITGNNSRLHSTVCTLNKYSKVAQIRNFLFYFWALLIEREICKLWMPYKRHHKPLLKTNHSLVLSKSIHKHRKIFLENREIAFKNGANFHFLTLSIQISFLSTPELLVNVSAIGNRLLLQPSCCKKRQKSPNQETGLGLKVLNVTRVILNN